MGPLVKQKDDLNEYEEVKIEFQTVEVSEMKQAQLIYTSVPGLSQQKLRSTRLNLTVVTKQVFHFCRKRRSLSAAAGTIVYDAPPEMNLKHRV